MEEERVEIEHGDEEAEEEKDSRAPHSKIETAALTLRYKLSASWRLALKATRPLSRVFAGEEGGKKGNTDPKTMLSDR